MRRLIYNSFMAELNKVAENTAINKYGGFLGNMLTGGAYGTILGSLMGGSAGYLKQTRDPSTTPRKNIDAVVGGINRGAVAGLAAGAVGAPLLHAALKPGYRQAADDFVENILLEPGYVKAKRYLMNNPPTETEARGMRYAINALNREYSPNELNLLAKDLTPLTAMDIVDRSEREYRDFLGSKEGVINKAMKSVAPTAGTTFGSIGGLVAGSTRQTKKEKTAQYQSLFDELLNIQKNQGLGVAKSLCR